MKRRPSYPFENVEASKLTKTLLFGRIALWGAQTEKYYLKFRGKLTPQIAVDLNRVQRGGYCQSFGALPTHLIINVVVTLTVLHVAKAISGQPIPITLLALPGLAAIGSSFLPVKSQSVRAAGSGRAAIRRRQLKFYISGLAMGMALTLSNVAFLGKSHSATFVTTPSDAGAAYAPQRSQTPQPRISKSPLKLSS